MSQSISLKGGIIMRNRMAVLMVLALLLGGCSSTGNLGIATKSMADPGAIITTAGRYKEIGPAKGEACRYILIGVIPWGDSTVTKAVGNALEETGGDALINISVTSNLYTFIPIYNVFCFTCTSVEGIAIKFEPQAKAP
jgi:uncharacterized protein YceK